MVYRWAPRVIVLALCAFPPRDAVAQAQSPPPPVRGVGSLGKVVPGPDKVKTRIPFTVGDSACTDSTSHVVTIQILNILAQLVAVPVLEAPGTQAATPGPAVSGPISTRKLPCGEYVADWNGELLDSGKPAAAGTYVVRLTVDGKSADNSKIVVAK